MCFIYKIIVVITFTRGCEGELIMPSNDWKQGFDPNQIANRLEKFRQTDTKGNFQGFNSFEFNDCRIILTEMFETSELIPKIDKGKIVWDSILNVAKKDKITASKIRREIRRLIKQYESKLDTQYVLICSLSIHNSRRITRRRFKNCTFTFHSHLEKRFLNQYNEKKEQADKYFNWQYPNNYIYAKVNILAKTPSQATEQALRNFDLLRGVWNLEINRRQKRISLNGLNRPINAISYGPLETLHFKNGKLATDIFWYQPEYQSPLKVINDTRLLGYIFDYEYKARQLLRNHNYKFDIEESIIRYVQALDSYNLQDSFIRLWGVLETLTGKGLQTQNETIRRTVFHYQKSSQEYVSQILNILKDYRNNSVHVGISDNTNIQSLVFILMRFVEVLLFFHIRNKFKFNSLQEAAEFCDLTYSKDEVNLRLIQYV